MDNQNNYKAEIVKRLDNKIIILLDREMSFDDFKKDHFSVNGTGNYEFTHQHNRSLILVENTLVKTGDVINFIE